MSKTNICIAVFVATVFVCFFGFLFHEYAFVMDTKVLEKIVSEVDIIGTGLHSTPTVFIVFTDGSYFQEYVADLGGVPSKGDVFKLILKYNRHGRVIGMRWKWIREGK